VSGLGLGLGLGIISIRRYRKIDR